jgi:hypothetical protein
MPGQIPEPNQATTFLEDIIKFYNLVANNKLGSTLLFIGLLLIFVTCGLAYKFIRSEPKDLTRWLPWAFFACLGIGTLLVFASPGVSWIESLRGSIRKIAADDSFENLRKNSRVDWLIRLISYDPMKQPDLSVSHLKTLGPEPQLYTFVSSYNELRGYNVREAVRMAGGHIMPGAHVSAIIFPRRFDIAPANAKGILQVVKNIQAEQSSQLENPLPFTDLNDGDQQNLKNRDNLPGWSWEGYKAHYKKFCLLSIDFNCNDYSEKMYMSRIEEDWNPLGFARRTPPGHGICEPESKSVCDISDWKQATQEFREAFGARAFLIRNYKMKSLADPYLIDFEQPDAQVIPDIGVPDVQE